MSGNRYQSPTYIEKVSGITGNQKGMIDFDKDVTTTKLATFLTLPLPWRSVLKIIIKIIFYRLYHSCHCVIEALSVVKR